MGTCFLHTSNEMPRQWYVSTEMHREITTCEELLIYFSHTFSFVDGDLVIHNALQHICDVVLKVVLVAYPMDPHEAPIMKSIME